MNLSIIGARQAENLSQDEFAQKLGISRKTLSKIENGNDSISLDLAYKISAICSLPVEDLFVNRYKPFSIINADYDNERYKKYETWLNQLIKFWENKKIKQILKLFAENCIYYESPFELIKYENLHIVWNEINATNIKNIKFKIIGFRNNSCTVNVVVEDTDGNITEMIYYFVLNKDNKCINFKQWYMEELWKQ